jgi:hypothetical protein
MPIGVLVELCGVFLRVLLPVAVLHDFGFLR